VLPFGMQRSYMYILVGSGLFNLVAIVPFPYFFGATGASISIHLSEFIVTATMGFLFWRAGTLRKKAARSSISSSPARGLVSPREKSRRSRHLRNQLEFIRRGNTRKCPILARRGRFVFSVLTNNGTCKLAWLFK
jgi:Polysaccharide biosynthesis C-terminal domain